MYKNGPSHRKGECRNISVDNEFTRTNSENVQKGNPNGNFYTSGESEKETQEDSLADCIRHCKNGYTSSKMVLAMGSSDLPVQLSSYLFVKKLLKHDTSLKLWKECLKNITSSSSEKSNLTLRIDRGMAATAKNIAHTMWYQSTYSLLNIDTHKLRGKPRDRPFMVVFIGEGATDFGGPFHEFLSSISREVMGKLSDSPDKSLPIFPLCIPCPNYTQAMGGRQDTVIINPKINSYNVKESDYVGEIDMIDNLENFRWQILHIYNSIRNMKKKLHKSQNSMYQGGHKSNEGNDSLDEEEGQNGEDQHLYDDCSGGKKDAREKLTDKNGDSHSHKNRSTQSCNINANGTLERGAPPHSEGNEKGNSNIDNYDCMESAERHAGDASSSGSGSPEGKHNNSGEELPGDMLPIHGGDKLANRGARNNDKMYLFGSKKSVTFEKIEQGNKMDFHVDNKYDQSGSYESCGYDSDVLEIVNNISLKTRHDFLKKILKKKKNETDEKIVCSEMDQKNIYSDSFKKNSKSGKKYNDLKKNHMNIEYDEKTTRAMELAMYESLGRVMGMCICIASALNICFNPIIWKKICGAPLELQDLCDYDFVAVEMLKTLKMVNCERSSGWNMELKQSLGDITFITEDSGGNSIELIRNGANIPINFDNLELFIRLMTRCKMNESSKGLRYLLKGFSSVIPLGRLRLLYEFTNVEHMVCGEREINLDVLKAHTWSNDLKIKDKLFAVLEEFTNEQLQSFLRFVSGRSRLPTTKNDWYMIIDVDNPNHSITQMDQRLPTAVTCGFRLLLPQYSSLEILKERLLYAIKNCTAIDLDAYVVHDQMQLMYGE